MDELSDQIRAYYDATIEPTPVRQRAVDGAGDPPKRIPKTPSDNGDERAAHQPLEFVALPVSAIDHHLEVVMSNPDRPTPRRRLWMAVAAAAAVVVVAIGAIAVASRDKDQKPVVSTNTLPVATVADTLPSAPVLPAAPSVDAVVPADARFRRPFTIAATGDALPADWNGATLADNGSAPTRLTSMDELPNSDRLNFLFEFCDDDNEDDQCSRGPDFGDADGAPAEDWPAAANRPFHIRHGFVNNGSEALGPGFDLAVYIFSEVDEPDQPHSIGPTQRYTTDYTVQGEGDACGPSNATEADTVSCEWFVHDFPDGLPEGRWVVWAVWEAPCQAWEDLEITECTDPDEVISLFSSGGSSPWS